MRRYVAFLRAINVAGHASLSMSRVREAFEAAGCASVRTVIQSGNVMFESRAGWSPTLIGQVQADLRARVGKEVTVLLREAEELTDLVRSRPFDGLGKERDVKCYVCFLRDKPPAGTRVPLVSDRESLEVIRISGREAFVVSRRIKGKAMYGFPNGFVEREFGTAATSRNWTTVLRIGALLSGSGTADARAAGGRRP